jgi:hypothetical protein
VLIGSGKNPIMFENQMKKKSPARKGNQRRARSLSGMLPPVMLLRVRS